MNQQQQQLNNSNKRSAVSLISFLDANPISTPKIRDHFVKSQASSIPQEIRLILWKLFLGVRNPFRGYECSEEKRLESHYEYMKHVVLDVLQMEASSQDEFNFFIYMLDRDYLPLKQDYIKNDNEAFCLIYMQLIEILDDQNDFESYYLTAQLYDYLKKNLHIMKEKLKSFLEANDNIANKALIQQINTEQFLLNGLAGMFSNVKMYHVIWDRLVMGEFELLVFTLVSVLEHLKEEHFKAIIDKKPHPIDGNLIKTLSKSIDQCKVLRKSTEYGIQHANSSSFSSSSSSTMSNNSSYGSIVNYFNK